MIWTALGFAGLAMAANGIMTKRIPAGPIQVGAGLGIVFFATIGGCAG